MCVHLYGRHEAGPRGCKGGFTCGSVICQLLLSLLTLVTKGRVERRESPRSKVLRAILLQQTNYEVMSKREEPSMNLHVECCPSVTRRVQPSGGISRDGTLLELYRDRSTVQRLFQTTCRPGVLDRPCSLLEPSIQPFSRCVQKYSYVYAFVRDVNVTGHYRMDYVKVRSGCSCEVDFTLN